MKKIWICMLVSLLSCGAYAQGKLEFDSYIHDFGDFLLSDGVKKCEFVFRNTGDKPVVIHNIISSCGCTEPEWTKAPVKPGESGKVKVTFLNDQGPYPFEKVLTVYNSATSRPVLLRIRGVVHDRKKSLEELYPVKMGGVALKKEKFDLKHIVRGDAARETFTVANLGKSSTTVSFANASKGITVVPASAEIAGRSTASFTVTFDTSSENVWGRVERGADILSAGRKCGRLEVSALLKPDFSDVPASRKAFAAMPVFRKSSFTFDHVTKGETVSSVFEYTNNGRDELEIYAVDTNSENIKVEFDTRKVASGKGGKVFVEINTGDIKGDEKLYVVTLVTNSPSRPLINLLVSVTLK